MSSWRVGAIILAMLFGPLPASAESAEPAMLEVFKDGKVGLDFRYRYEFVDDDAFSKDANASTLRSRLRFASGTYREVSFFVEVEDVRELKPDDFNSGDQEVALVFGTLLLTLGIGSLLASVAAFGFARLWGDGRPADGEVT